jgi:hypothetical protein
MHSEMPRSSASLISSISGLNAFIKFVCLHHLSLPSFDLAVARMWTQQGTVQIRCLFGSELSRERKKADDSQDLVQLQFLLGESSNYVLFLEFFPEKIHCIHLRFGDALHINIHCGADVAVPQNCLNVLIRHTKLM